jgi:hypothetical protein
MGSSFQTADTPVGTQLRPAPQVAGDAETARLALKRTWEQLAPIVDEAREFESQVSQNPRLLSDPWVAAHTRWLQIFGREIDAVQTVYSTTKAGARLSIEEIRQARDAGQKLLRFIEDGRQIVRPRSDERSSSESAPGS